MSKILFLSKKVLNYNPFLCAVKVKLNFSVSCQCLKKEAPKASKKAPKKEASEECENEKPKKAAKDDSKEKEKGPQNKTFVIYRFTQECKKKPGLQKYTIDLKSCGPMVLDALIYIKQNLDSSLTYRRSCREGVCGSCAVNVDGVNCLACIKKITPKGITSIYPLPHMYVIKDLVVDLSRFYDQHRRIMPYLIRNTQEPIGEKQYLQSLKDRDLLDGYVECIMCACCSTSCPVYWWHGHSEKDFLGPAALLAAYRWLRDSRDEGTECRLEALRDYWSIYRCHTIYNCTNCCPKNLNPGGAIANIRVKLATKAKKVGELTGLV